jgi:hypothetical protein
MVHAFATAPLFFSFFALLVLAAPNPELSERYCVGRLQSCDPLFNQCCWGLLCEPLPTAGGGVSANVTILNESVTHELLLFPEALHMTTYGCTVW